MFPGCKPKWFRCENKPKFILITKPIEHSLGSKKELCQKHLQEYIKSYKLNDRNYKVIEIK